MLAHTQMYRDLNGGVCLVLVALLVFNYLNAFCFLNRFGLMFENYHIGNYSSLKIGGVVELLLGQKRSVDNLHTFSCFSLVQPQSLKPSIDDVDI